jgi:hypothetical protein
MGYGKARPGIAYGNEHYIAQKKVAAAAGYLQDTRPAGDTGMCQYAGFAFPLWLRYDEGEALYALASH